MDPIVGAVVDTSNSVRYGDDSVGNVSFSVGGVTDIADDVAVNVIDVFDTFDPFRRAGPQALVLTPDRVTMRPVLWKVSPSVTSVLAACSAETLGDLAAPAYVLLDAGQR